MVRIRKEVAYFKQLIEHLPERTEETMKNNKCVSPPNRESKTRPPEYETGQKHFCRYACDSNLSLNHNPTNIKENSHR
jgi:hypothetical protein